MFYLDVALILLTVVAIEVDNLLIASLVLGINGVLFILRFCPHIPEFIPTALLLVIFVPVAVYCLSIRTKKYEEKAILSGSVSVFTLLFLVALGYAISISVFRYYDLRIPLMIAGTYGVLAKTDLRKVAISLSILSSTIHIFAEPLGFEISLALVSLPIMLIGMILYMANKLFLQENSLSTRDLRRLRW